MVYPNRNETLPVAVVVGGPIGLVAAAHLLDGGITPLVLEAGAGPGASMRTVSRRSRRPLLAAFMRPP